jgi:hypothetical protein
LHKKRVKDVSLWGILPQLLLIINPAGSKVQREHLSSHTQAKGKEKTENRRRSNKGNVIIRRFCVNVWVCAASIWTITHSCPYPILLFSRFSLSGRKKKSTHCSTNAADRKENKKRKDDRVQAQAELYSRFFTSSLRSLSYPDHERYILVYFIPLLPSFLPLSLFMVPLNARTNTASAYVCVCVCKPYFFEEEESLSYPSLSLSL